MLMNEGNILSKIFCNSYIFIYVFFYLAYVHFLYTFHFDGTHQNHQKHKPLAVCQKYSVKLMLIMSSTKISSSLFSYHNISKYKVRGIKNYTSIL